MQETYSQVRFDLAIIFFKMKIYATSEQIKILKKN